MADRTTRCCARRSVGRSSRATSSSLLAVGRTGRTVTPEELRACAQEAEAHGRWMDARNAYLLLDDEGAIRAIAEHLPAGLKPAPEADEEEA